MPAFTASVKFENGMATIDIRRSSNMYDMYNIAYIGKGYIEVVYGDLQFARLALSEDWDFAFTNGTLLCGMDDGFTSLTLVGTRKGKTDPEVQINFFCTEQYEKIVRAIVLDKMEAEEAFKKFANK